MAFNSYYQTVKLKNNLYGYFWEGGGNNCNSYLLVDLLKGGHPHVIIDPGHVVNELKESCFQELVGAIQADGFKIEDIGLVLNTHAHPDHYAAGEKLLQDSEKARPPFIAFSQEEYDFWKKQGENASELMGISFQKTEPFLLLSEGELNLGKIKLRVIPTPGHSPGSVCFYWAQEKILFTGDTVFAGSIGRTDLPGGNPRHLLASIEKLSGLEVEYLLAGHSTEYGSYLKGRDLIARNFQLIKMYLS